ncbi:MAG: hypothetical protein K0M45_07815 [Candidatus Paracaedibacteraceae bacterium]|nr:hypothetical protein [Candidatus Paracaedibacteraceae bacterium]
MLVRLEPKRVSLDQAYVSLYDKCLPIYADKLTSYNLKKISLVFEGVIRKAGLIQTLPLISSPQILYTHQFMTINQSVKLPAPGKILYPIGLGGCWEPGYNLEMIEQFYIWFYEADDEIKYFLKPWTHWRLKGTTPPSPHSIYNNLEGVDSIPHQPLSLVAAIRGGRCNLRLNKGNSDEDHTCSVYYSSDIQPHGLTHAWISFKEKSSIPSP